VRKRKRLEKEETKVQTEKEGGEENEGVVRSEKPWRDGGSV